MFKRLHKNLASNFYGLDVDFCCVEKRPAGIAAFIDYKTPWEAITFSEVIAYNDLMALAPVYVIRAADPERGPFQVFEYLGGDFKPDPPVVKLEFRANCKDWLALGTWEAMARTAFRKRRAS